MPSAQRRQFEGPSQVSNGNGRSELHLLLEAIRPSNGNSLNSLYGRGSVIFAEGEQARGIYILHSGRATVSIGSSDGRVVMLRLAGAGDVLGLNSVLGNYAHDTTVKSLEPCRIHFISRRDVLEFAQTEAGAQAIAKLLSRELTEVTERAKSLLLPATVNGRLANLLLDLSKEDDWDGSRSARVERVLTHEEIAQMICSSRETVTRQLAKLSIQQLIRVTPDTIEIRDRTALERLALC